MFLVGQFKVVSKKARDNGNFSYELGDTATFSSFRIVLPSDLENDKVHELKLPVKVKTGKYGQYLELVN